MTFIGIFVLLLIPGTVAIIMAVVLGIRALVKRAAEKEDRERLEAEMEAVKSAEIESDNPYMQKKENI